MSAADRTTRLADRLPVAMAEGPVVRALLGALAQEFEGADQAVFRLFRSRHLHQADSWWGTRPTESTDLGRLGGLIGLQPLSGERNADYRDRVLGLMSVHRAGLGTAEAVLRLAGLALRFEGAVRTEVVLRGTDRVMVATGRVRVGGLLQDVALELVDNPPTSRELEKVAWGPEDRVVVTSHSVVPAPLEISLQAADIMVAPMFRRDGVALIYAGTVPAGASLQMRPDGARLDGFAAPAPLLACRVDVLDGAPSSAGARFASPLVLGDALCLPPGDSVWTLSMISPGAARALATEAGLPCDLVGDDEPCAATPTVRMHWQDRAAAAFTLRYPDVLPDWAKDRSEVAAALVRALEYGRAAGIQGRLQLHVQITDEGVVPQDRPARVGMGVREDAEPQVRASINASLSTRDRVRINDQAREIGYTKFSRRPRGEDGFPLDGSMLVEARDAMFDRSPTDGARLDYDGLDEARPAVIGVARFEYDALAWDGAAPAPEIALDPNDPRLAARPLALGLDEVPDASAGHLDRDVLGTERPARFEGDGLRLDYVALAFNLQPGLFGRARLGAAGFLPRNPEPPPEGWPTPPRKTSLKLELSDIADEPTSDQTETGEDDG